MVPWTFWVLLLLCSTTRFFSSLCLGTPLQDLRTSQELRTLQKEELWEHLDGWLSPENPSNPSLQLLDETLTTESNTSLLLAQQHWMEEMMEKLQKVNQSLGLLLVAMEGARNQLENHLQELHSVLEPSGWSPSAISTCILHGFGVLVGFLVPTPPRAVLLLLLAFSTLGDLLGIQALTTSLLLSMAGQCLVTATCCGARRAWPVSPCHQLTSTPERGHEMELLQEELDRMGISCLQELSCLEEHPGVARDHPGLAGKVSPTPSGWRTNMTLCGVKPQLTLGTRKSWETKRYNPKQSMTSDVSLTSPRSPCQGLTKAGQRCRKKAIPGQDFCHVHATTQSSCMDSPPHL